MKTQNQNKIQAITHYKFKSISALAAAVVLFAVTNTQAQTNVITFEDLAIGSTLGSQYSALGVTFSPNAFSGAGGPTGDWASNTGMTIVSSTGADVGGLGTPAGTVSGNILRSFNSDWLSEDGDASFLVSFTSPVSFFSAAFAGVSTSSSTRIFAYNGATLLGTVAGTTTGQFTLSFASASITSVVVTPGDFFDWVGVDNITFAPVGVPEPGTIALATLGGLTLIGVRRRMAAKK